MWLLTKDPETLILYLQDDKEICSGQLRALPNLQFKTNLLVRNGTI
jgi:hypothetical protein